MVEIKMKDNEIGDIGEKRGCRIKRMVGKKINEKMVN